MAKIRRLASGIVVLLAIGGRLLAADASKTPDTLPAVKSTDDKAATAVSDAKTVAQATDSKALAADTKIVVPLPPPPVVYEAPATNWCGVNDSRGARLKADIGFMVLTPRWTSNPALTIINTGTGIASTEQRDFDFNAQFVPTVSVGGVLANGFGARANWWAFAVGDRVSASVSGTGQTIIPSGDSLFTGLGNTTALLATARLRMNVWDFEFTDDIRLSRWVGLVGLGVRYAHLSQDYAASPTDIALGGATVIASHNFNGAGPTLALELHRDLGCAGLYFYGYGRGSVLFGNAKESSEVVAIDDTLGSFASATQKNPVLPVGELDFGLGWNRAVSRTVLYAQVGFVGQVWFGTGNSNIDGVLSSLGLDTSHRNDNLGLIGLSFRTGVNF
jgi:hypothetical protein